MPPTSTHATTPDHQLGDAGDAGEARRLLDRRITLVVANAASLMLVMATSSANVALPDIQRRFDVSAAGLSWVITGYAVAFAGLILLSGKLGAIFGGRRVLLAGTGIFLAASLAAGFAPSAEVLVVARIVQGLGAAVAAPSTLALVIANTEAGHGRNVAISVFVLARNAGVGVGVLAGGLLTSAIGWRWVMLVNVPLAVAILLGAVVYVRETERKRVSLDYAGGVITTLVMASLVLGFTDAAQYGWGTWQAIVPILLAVGGTGVLVAVERRHADAVVPVDLFARMHQVAPYAALLLVSSGSYAFFYFGSLFMQNVMGYDATRTGLAILPFVLAMVVVSQITPRVLQLIGERVATVAGAAIMTVGLLWLAALDEGATYVGSLLGPELVIGAGIGLSTGPITSLVMHHAPATHVSEASAMLQAMLQLGGAVGVASLTSVYVRGEQDGGLAGGVSAAVCGGAVFAAVALVLVAAWGTRVTPRRARPAS